MAQPHQNSSLQFNETNPVLSNLFDIVKSNFTYNSNVNENNTYDSWFYIPESVGQNTGIRRSTYRRIKNIQSIRPTNFHI